MDTQNCALADDCRCARLIDAVGDDGAVKYWQCENWARSTLPFPRVGHPDQHYGVPTKESMKRTADDLHRKQRKHESWLAKTNQRLGDVRHSDIRKNLRKKGVKV